MSTVLKAAAVACTIASAALAIYCVLLAYAAATFAHDSLPGPVVLNIAAGTVALSAVLVGGLAHVLWKKGKRRL